MPRKKWSFLKAHPCFLLPFPLIQWPVPSCVSWTLNCSLLLSEPARNSLLSRGFLLSFLDSYPSQLQNSPNALGMGAPDLSFVVSHPFFSLGIWLLKSLKLSLQPYEIIRTSAHFSVPRSDPPSGHQILSIIQKSPIVPKKKQLNTSVVLFPLESWLLSIVLTFLSYLKVYFLFFFNSF